MDQFLAALWNGSAMSRLAFNNNTFYRNVLQRNLQIILWHTKYSPVLSVSGMGPCPFAPLLRCYYTASNPPIHPFQSLVNVPDRRGNFGFWIIKLFTLENCISRAVQSMVPLPQTTTIAPLNWYYYYCRVCTRMPQRLGSISPSIRTQIKCTLDALLPGLPKLSSCPGNHIWAQLAIQPINNGTHPRCQPRRHHNNLGNSIGNGAPAPPAADPLRKPIDDAMLLPLLLCYYGSSWVEPSRLNCCHSSSVVRK